MSFSEFVQNMHEDNHSVLTVVIPAGTTKKQIRQYIADETKVLLNTENARYEYVGILLALLVSIERNMHPNKDILDNPQVFSALGLPYLAMGQLPMTASYLLAKNPPEICHKWGNYPAFDLFADLLKD